MYKRANQETNEEMAVVAGHRLVVEDISLNIFTRIGNWVERHFPEKMTASDVQKIFKSHEITLESHQRDIESHQNAFLKLCALETDVEKFRNELNMLKNLVAIKSRIVTPQISAFASRPNGGLTTK